MLYNKDTLNKRQTKGTVTYNRDIVLSVINLATKEIAGVSSMVPKFDSTLKMWFSKNYYEGVHVTYSGEIMNVNVYINVYFGYNVSEISYRVQENIKNSLSSMIEIRIGKINVHVVGVDFPKEEIV